jgi:primosomal protein N' (replication factor Y) (superfamily II helicase)
MGFPPFGSLAEVSGSGADAFLEPLVNRLDLGTTRVLGPRADGRYLVRAETPDELATLLARLPPSKPRARVAIDPPRV